MSHAAAGSGLDHAQVPGVVIVTITLPVSPSADAGATSRTERDDGRRGRLYRRFNYGRRMAGIFEVEAVRQVLVDQVPGLLLCRVEDLPAADFYAVEGEVCYCYESPVFYSFTVILPDPVLTGFPTHGVAPGAFCVTFWPLTLH